MRRSPARRSRRRRAKGGGIGYGRWGLPLGWPDLAAVLGGSHHSQSQVALPDAPRYAAKPALLQRDAHEFVNKNPFVQGVSAERMVSAEPSCVRVAPTGLGVHER